MLKNLFDRLLHEDEEGVTKEILVKKKSLLSRINKKNLTIFLGIFIATLAVRLVFLFFVSNPQNAGVGWYGDSYHHWQIAYLSKEIGFNHGFLRLWDLKGMEYFWGLAHPLFTTLLMTLTGSSDIIIVRLLSSIAGSLSIAVLFFLIRKYWGTKTAIASIVIACLNPVLIFNEASGMVEPLGILFLLLGVYLWEEYTFLSGILFAIASMTRAENWLFSVGLIGFVLIFTKVHPDKKIKLLISYLIVILIYMKYLLDHTGNAIYPIWWNFLGNAAGAWQANIPARPDQIMIQPIWICIFVESLLGIIYVAWKKPKNYLFHLLGLGNFMFLGAFVGLTKYLKSYEAYFWVVRIFDLPYLYLGVLISILLFVAIPKIIPFVAKFKINWLVFVVILFTIQPLWLFIWRLYEPTTKYWDAEVALAKNIGSYYNGGTVLIHEGDPVLTYALIKETHLKASNIEGQMYDPFQYKPFNSYNDPFEHWDEDRGIILDWLKKDDIHLLVFIAGRTRYEELVKREPEIFKFIKDDSFGLKIYEVNI